MNERELFEQWVKKEHAHIFNGAERGDVRFRMDIDFMYMAWQASANRKGYEIVPVEPTERMLDSAYSSISDNLHYADLENIYTAMIGAVE